MAATSIVLQSCLCFLVKRYGKIAVKPLKSMLLDFYGVDELYAAKQQLMSDITGMNLDTDLPHIPERRDGDSKAVRIVDDLFTMLTFLDESLNISNLPSYVADSPDAMPSSRLYEGDLSVLMRVIERMENEIRELNLALAAIAKDVRQKPGDQAVQVSSRAVVNSDVDASAEPRAQSGYPTTTGGGVMTSGESCQLMGDPRPIRHEHTTRDWASAVAASTPTATNNRFAMLHATTDDDDNEHNENYFTEVRHRRSAKRRRPNGSLQQQQAGSTNHQLQSQTQQQIQAGQRRGRGRVMLTGKCGSRDQRFVAAKKIVKKAIFCIDNVDPSSDVNDLCQFVQSMNVKVISCFPAHPRRRRNETGPVADRKAFRLCVDDADRDRLLDDSKWPDSVVISEWYHLDPKDRKKPTVSGKDEEVAAAASSEAGDNDNTMLYSSNDNVESLDRPSAADDGVQS